MSVFPFFDRSQLIQQREKMENNSDKGNENEAQEKIDD
jgi:hypothetical protein